MTKWLILLLCFAVAMLSANPTIEPLVEVPDEQEWSDAVAAKDIDTMYPNNLLVDLKEAMAANPALIEQVDLDKVTGLVGTPTGGGLLRELADAGYGSDVPPAEPVWNWANAPEAKYNTVDVLTTQDVIDEETGEATGETIQVVIGTEQVFSHYDYSDATGAWETDEWDIQPRNWDPNAKDVATDVYTAQNMDGLFQTANNVVNNINTAFDEVAGLPGTEAKLAEFKADLSSMIGFYAEDMAADEVIKVYTEENTAGTPIAQQNYLDDLMELQRYYENEAGNIAFMANNQNELDSEDQDQSKAFDPRSYLDKSVTDRVSKQAVKLELLFAGAGNKFETKYLFKGDLQAYTIQSLSQEFQQKLASYGTIDKDLQWFNQTWGAYEGSVMHGSEDPYGDAENYKTTVGDWGSSYAVNAYGEVVKDDPNTDENEYTSLEGIGFDSAITHTYTIQTGRFNNRQWGYSDGVKTNAQITMNNKTYQLTQSYFTSPIVLDMNGDGELEASAGQWLPGHSFKEGTMVEEFDINGDGFLEMIEWVGPNDGLLIRYDEKADLSANQLYGHAGGWSNGFEKMVYEDLNKDGVLSGSELEGLSVWQDKNSNAKVDEGELASVQDLGITEIKTSHKMYKSSFVKNGESFNSWDWHPLTFNVRRVK